MWEIWKIMLDFFPLKYILLKLSKHYIGLQKITIILGQNQVRSYTKVLYTMHSQTLNKLVPCYQSETRIKCGRPDLTSIITVLIHL